MEGVEDLLFDDLALSTSRKYFILLQHLRIYEEWIVGTCKGLSSWSSVRNAWLEFYIEPAIRRMDPGVDDLSRQTEDLLTAWEGTVRTAKHGFEPILTRIRAKRDEIVTLRDGVCTELVLRRKLYG